MYIDEISLICDTFVLGLKVNIYQHFNYDGNMWRCHFLQVRNEYLIYSMSRIRIPATQKLKKTMKEQHQSLQPHQHF